MKSIDAGVADKCGVQVPLTSGAGPRNATLAAANALRAAIPSMPDKSKEMAQHTLKGLKDLGCISEEEVRLPQYDKNGRPNGTQTGNGLVTHWDRVPWGLEDDADDPEAVDAQERSAPEGATDNTVAPPPEPITRGTDGDSPVKTPEALSPCRDPVPAFEQVDRQEG
jgi:hypothetical protein